MLAEILQDIKKYKETAKMDVDPVKHAKVYQSRLGTKNRAKDELERLFVEYKNNIRPMLLFIVVAGNGGKKFAELCEKNKWAFSYDALSFYDELVSDIDPANWKDKPFGANMVDILGRKVEDKADECDVIQYDMMMFKNKYSRHINNKEELVTHVADIFNEQIGVEFMGFDILNKIAIKAVEEEFDGEKMPILPVIIKVDSNLGVTQEILQHFPKISPYSFLVTAGVGVPKAFGDIASVAIKKVDKENVVKVLKKINELRQ